MDRAVDAVDGSPPFRYTLGVVSDAEHWQDVDGGLWAYEPYVREMRIWARLFERVVVCAPRGAGPIAGHAACYGAANVQWRPVAYSGRQGVRGRAARFLQMFWLAAALDRLARTSDLVLVRSPSHAGLIARPIARLRGRRTLTRWTGYFGDPGDEPPARRLERRMVERMRAPALVYGGADRADHLVPFIPAFMSEAEMERARLRSAGKQWAPPWRLLSVGRLSEEKGFDMALEALAKLRERDPALDWHYRIVGEGVERDRLERLTAGLGLGDRVTFLGGLPFERVQELYTETHVVIQSSRIEGFVKIVPEAWAHGAVPVAAAVGHTPEVMRGTDAGVLYERNAGALTAALHGLLSDPVAMETMSRHGYRHLPRLSLECFEERLRQVLVERCGL